ncbi:hypothetical protein ACH5RR_031722 [Cinchona calisaya]|uniref:RING-type domain-containing protein n=1 Tax=Cinchona calisaya TaxID=153742 RepID=A0ABD2YJG7_9GENT
MNPKLKGFGFSKIAQNPSKILDQMDIDHVPDVPDTPDRVTAQNVNGKSIVERGNNLSTSGHSGNRNCFNERSKIQFKVNDNGSAVSSMGAQKSTVASTISACRSSSDFVSGNSSSSNNCSTLRRSLTDEIPNHGHKHLQPAKNDKSMCAQSSARQEGSVVDLTEHNVHVGVSRNFFPCGSPGSSRAGEYGKRPLSLDRLSSSKSMGKSSIISGFANKGKESDNTVLGCDRADEAQPKAGKVVSTSLNTTSLPRVTGQKRLVRNGCISPHNIAKAKHSVAKDKNVSAIAVNHALPVASSSSQIAIDANEWIGEDLGSHTSKGKGVMCCPLSVKDPDAQSTHPPGRNAVNINEIVKEAGDTSRDAFGGWRSTRNRSKKTSISFSHDSQSLPRGQGDHSLINRLPPHMVERGEIGSEAGTSHRNPLDLEEASSQDAFLLPGGQRGSYLRPQLGLGNGRHPAKRQKQGLTSSSLGPRGECSRATMDHTDVVFLGSPENAGESRTIKTVSQNTFGSLEPVIEIDETNSEARGYGSSNGGNSSNDASAMARQMETDEMLARELQEQFYNEAPSASGDIDAHMTLALQHGEALSNVFSRRSRPFNARSSSSTNSSRQSRSSSPLSLLRRGSQARAPAVNRLARVRNRFPGRPRTVASSTPRNSLFPADMDVDLRMYILEALEAINDMGVDNGLLQTQRDFNENDYEMLLALDENNHQHGGASTAQINSLPQSTVQCDNLEEACAICLETPTMGDTIRHLPCLHKFHKDCIDPWLMRRTSCPVCKSSIN